MVFINAGEDSIMADNVIMPSNPPITPVEEDELEEAPLDVNVSQQSHKEDPFRKVVRIRVDRSTWDH